MRLILDPGSTCGNDRTKLIEMVDFCAEINAELKFQLFTDSTGSNIPLNRTFYRETAAYARAHGVHMFASAWDRDAVETIKNSGGRSVKFAYSQRNSPLIYFSLLEGLEVIVSYGWMDEPLPEVQALWCIPEYPVIYRPRFNKIFDKFDGFSDHTLGIDCTIEAIDAGAQIIEKHVMPEDPMDVPDSKFAITVQEARELSEYINSRQSRNDGKTLQLDTPQTGNQTSTGGPGVRAASHDFQY